MKRFFTKLVSAGTFMGLICLGLNGSAQTTLAAVGKLEKQTNPETTIEKKDTSATAVKAVSTPVASTSAKPAADEEWKPVRRLWGYAFGDFYYNAHADATNRGGETNYNGVPTYRNAFQIRRVYLGYDYDISKRFTATLLLASEPGANTGVNGTSSIQNGDNLVDNKMSFFIKNINLKWNNIWNGTNFIVGIQGTPGFAKLTESIWGYRSIEKTVADFHKESGSYDLGASLEGVFDPATKNFGYDLMIGNNSGAGLLSAASPTTGFYKMLYGDVYAKFLDKKLILDIYVDNLRTSPATAALAGQSRTTFKGFAAYTTKKVTFGVEAYTTKIKNGVTNTTTNAAEDATIEAISLYARGAVYKDKVGFFARYDNYNPDNDLIVTDAYKANATAIGNYNPYYKENFYTLGLDFTPEKNIHFMPNIWLVDYKDQRSSSTTGYVANDHNLVYRLTFYYVFGK